MVLQGLFLEGGVIFLFIYSRNEFARMRVDAN